MPPRDSQHQQDMINTAVVVGGSLSGLIAGLQLKRQGVDVTILEQDVTSDRSSHNAGIQLSENVSEVFRRHDETGLRLALGSAGSRWSVRSRQDVLRVGVATRYFTNWAYAYRILRANFDGHASKACPNPPGARRGDGSARYLTGKRVKSLYYADGLVTLHYVDQAGQEDTITCQLVVGADGFSSTIRKLVQAPQALPDQFTGYFAWRGAVPRKMVSKETADYFLGNVSFDLMGGKAYILCYVIPTDNGSFDEGELLLNWLIYENLVEGSPEEEEIFTDRHGRRCQRTVPQGRLNPAVWERHRDALVRRMIPPFAEIVSRSPTPFVTKVSEHLGSRASFHDGHVVLLGDSLAAYRPNLGRATDQAASQCLSLAEVWSGGKTLAAWEHQCCREANRVLLMSRVASELGRGSWFSLFRSLASYLWFNLTVMLRGASYWLK